MLFSNSSARNDKDLNWLFVACEFYNVEIIVMRNSEKCTDVNQQIIGYNQKTFNNYEEKLDQQSHAQYE